MTAYKIHPIVLGTKIFDKSMMTYQHGYGQSYTIPIYCWYLQGGDQTILVDTGEMHPIQSQEREQAINGAIYTFEQGLAKWQLKPEDIDIVIHTHLHNDHCENDYKCENAVFYVHEKELTHVHNPHPLDFRYVEDYILDVEENGQIKTVRQDRQICPGISVIHTPAHSPGGLSVSVQTSLGTAVITGFCVIEENFNPPKKVRAMEMDVIPPGTHVNSYEAYDILKKIKASADFLIPLHEPKFAAVDTIG
ncbi:MAG: N-acyl homoserine lactonase family protein [Desulfobacteraceae bacterium]|nr:N-acyl homoserine lactonase family protein [Desulfobacteraceae bacterium]